MGIEHSEPAPVHTVPPLGRRIAGVLFDPKETFRSLDASWGLLAPWAAIAGSGLLYGLIHVAQVDEKLLGAQRAAYAQTFLSDQMRRLQAGQEQMVDPGKVAGFASKLAHFIGPTVGSIVEIVTVGLLLFVASSALGGRKDLLRAIVVSAHAKLVAIAGYAVLLAALVLGNPQPATSPRNVADEVAHPIGWALLDLLDPIAIWHGVLVFLGLTVALEVRRSRAALVAASIVVLPWLLEVGACALQLIGRK